MNKWTKNLVAFGLAMTLCLPLVAVAQSGGDNPPQGANIKGNFDTVGEYAAMSTRSLPETIGFLINSFLGLLGIILVVIIIYAGYLWMTDMGNAENVKKAKSMIVQAIIGMVILMAAYAIASFVIDAIMAGTGQIEGA